MMRKTFGRPYPQVLTPLGLDQAVNEGANSVFAAGMIIARK